MASSSDSSGSESNSESSEIHEEERDIQPFTGCIQPWRFEPNARSTPMDVFSNANLDQLSDGSDHIPPSRMDNTDWCQCDNCQRLDRVEECVCCQEIDSIVAKNKEVVVVEGKAEPTCITRHPGFDGVCLNHWVLQTAWHQYKQQYVNAYDGPEHKKNRHIAYRQLVRWCWGFLGREIRVPLPSCAVCCIRAHFPPPGLEENFVFTGLRFSDE